MHTYTAQVHVYTCMSYDAASVAHGQTMERDKQEAIAEEAKTMEKLANKRSLMLKKVKCIYEPSILSQLLYACMLLWSRLCNQKEESMRKIRELGSLPSDAFDKYQGLTLTQVRHNHTQHLTNSLSSTPLPPPTLTPTASISLSFSHLILCLISSPIPYASSSFLLTSIPVVEETTALQCKPQEVQPCQQEGPGSVCELLGAEGPANVKEGRAGPCLPVHPGVDGGAGDEEAWGHSVHLQAGQQASQAFMFCEWGCIIHVHVVHSTSMSIIHTHMVCPFN